MNDNYENFDAILNKYDELSAGLSDPGTIADQDAYRRLMKEFSSISPLAAKVKERGRLLGDLADAQSMLGDKPDRELRDFLTEEIAAVREKLSAVDGELKIMLLPKDPNDEKSVIIEIRAGAGGEEAALFAGVLYRMYGMYAEQRGWRHELVDANATGIGGFKEIVFSIEADGAYSRFKFESGVHRVQRVPATESSGRIHTSTVTVAVLAEADEVDVDINPSDLEIDTFRASGAGGQHINKTDSAIRITHKPSGIVVTCQDQRSQHKNRDRAMAVLRSKLFDIAIMEQESGLAQERREQVGRGNRNERIRTYNYHQGRVTDHRINLTLYKIDEILNGDLDEVIDNLVTAEQARRLGEYSGEGGAGGGIGGGGATGEDGAAGA
ncbi:MAG: peptide chain release factor 1 [Oscillospiraceae bacterium]|nr:peptide chain release factor 1 [Oscillospiraceae bacterium]